MTDTPEYFAIVLAAGLSRRMGDINKLLMPVKGQPMVRRLAQLYLGLGIQTTVVTGFDAANIADAVAGLPIHLTHNPAYAEGHETSAIAGLAACPRSHHAIISMADLPFLTQDDVRGQISAFECDGRNRILVPRFEGIRGHPVMVPRDHVSEMLASDMPQSPRAYMDGHPDAIMFWDVPNDHFTRDIDTPDEAARWL